MNLHANGKNGGDNSVYGWPHLLGVVLTNSHCEAPYGLAKWAADPRSDNTDGPIC